MHCSALIYPHKSLFKIPDIKQQRGLFWAEICLIFTCDAITFPIVLHGANTNLTCFLLYLMMGNENRWVWIEEYTWKWRNRNVWFFLMPPAATLFEVSFAFGFNVVDIRCWAIIKYNCKECKLMRSQLENN